MHVARLYDLEQLRALVAPVAKDFGVRSVYAFGSYGRGQASGESDLDLRIEAGAIRSLFALADFRQTLEERLNIPWTSSPRISRPGLSARHRTRRGAFVC